MKNKWAHKMLFLFLTLISSCLLSGQTWKFVKENNGVQIYTRQEPGKSLKSFKGVADINESAEKVFTLIEDINHTEWWDKNLTQIKVLLYEKDKRAQYYLVYNMPPPFKNRDLSVKVEVTIDQATGESKIIAVPLSGVIPEHKDLVRIKNYRQVWTVKPIGKNKTHVELEFYVEPVDNLPEWLLNMVLINSPVNSIKGLKQCLEKGKK